MAKKRIVLASAAVLIFLGALLLVFSPRSVRAQCGEPPVPSCVNCHEAQSQPNSSDQWHASHSRFAACTDCHGGNATAADEAQSHEAMAANPLADIYTSCFKCHPENYQVAAAGYASTLNVTPSSCATPTTVPQGGTAGGFWTGGMVLPNTHLATFSAWSVGGIALSLAGIAVFLLALSWLLRHEQKA